MSRDAERYTAAWSAPEDPLLEELTRVTHQRATHPQMLSGHIQGKLLEALVRMLRPQNILEIGTFTGYSALSMAAGLAPEGHIDTIEADDEVEPIAREFFARSPHANKITQHIGSALRIAPTLKKNYDLVFLDGDKREYPAYYRMLFEAKLIQSGSWILADNILWYGKVAETPMPTDPHTAAIHEFNRQVKEDRRVENVILPLRDGLNLIRVK